MGIVVKNGGRKQAFSSAKIRKSIEKVAKDAKLNKTKIKSLLKEVAEPVIKLYSKERSVKATALRKSILRGLDRRIKRVSQAWRRFDRRKA